MARAAPAASPARGPAVRAVMAGPQSEPVLAVTMSAGLDGTVVRGSLEDVRSKTSTVKGSRSGLGTVGRRRSASMAAAPPTAGGAAGGRPFRMRQAPSSLDVYEHQAGLKITVPVGKMCDACKVKPAAYPDKNDWNCADCQFKEPS